MSQLFLFFTFNIGFLSYVTTIDLNFIIINIILKIKRFKPGL